MLESIKAKYALKITQVNSKIQEIAEREPSDNKRAIGFTSEPAILEEDDECEED